MPIPQFAPGCFGSALTYREGDMVCGRCPFASDCEGEHIAALTRLRQKLGIEVKPSPIRRSAKPQRAIDDPTLATVPVKVRALLQKLDGMSLDIVAKMQRGENPFLKVMPFMAIAAHLLIKAQRPLGQKTLAAALAMKLGWKEGTADAHARMALQALEHVGAIILIDGGAVMKRN